MILITHLYSNCDFIEEVIQFLKGVILAYLKAAQFYDLFAIGKEQEQAFYRQIAQKVGSPALELGVGTGIFAFLLANDGIEVVGIDTSPYMLKEARRKLQQAPPTIANRLTFLKEDMADFQLNRIFRLIYIPSQSFQYLDTREKQVNCLHCIHNHLNSQGQFVFDIWVGQIDASGTWRRLETIPLPKGGAITRSISTRILESEGIIDTTLRFDILDNTGQLQKTYWDRSHLAILTIEEMQQLLGKAGFHVESLYSSFTQDSWIPNANQAIFVASRAST